jgi:hypothetical protein
MSPVKPSDDRPLEEIKNLRRRRGRLRSTMYGSGTSYCDWYIFMATTYLYGDGPSDGDATSDRQRQLRFHSFFRVFNNSVKKSVEKSSVASTSACKLRLFTLCTSSGANVKRR